MALAPAIGPLVEEQLVIPLTPVIAQKDDPDAVGATPPVGPETVAWKVIVLPKDAEVCSAKTDTVGFAFATVTVAPEDGPAAA